MALLALTTLIVFILTLYSIRSMDLPEFKDVSNTDEVECHYENHTAGDLRVMTFNIWYNGKQVDDGIEKIAKHINIVNPDAVCLQEVSTLHDLDRILDAAGEKWNAVSKPSVYADVAIMTRHQILNETFISGKFVGATIESENGRKIRIVNGHLQYKMYGIYAAFNKLVTNISQIMDGEINPQNFSTF
jgi:endonuclease/exonuclease/phosphatase (EEP) superfamily protein YafD